MPNSPLREEPRERRAAVIPVRQEPSLLDWLQSSGRLIARDNQDPDLLLDEVGIADELLGTDDSTYDDLDDDDDVIDPDLE